MNCPWCEAQNIFEDEAMTKQTVIAFACPVCKNPVVVIEKKAFKIDVEVLKTGQIVKLQEYILRLLEEKFNTNAEITNMETSTQVSLIQPSPITKADIEKMKIFLEKYKIPLEGEMFKES